ncbi:MAG TPA: uroporphyrinogen-III synthase [Ktedonobacteraceae bacterium]|jgi:uroporphyrinogen-III synthase
MGNFTGTRVALLEARMSHEIADMVRRYGGEPYCAPAVRESSLDSDESVSAFIDHLTNSSLQTVVFLTGVGVNALVRAAEKLGREDELLTALRHVTVACRGPKPGSVLRRLQIPIAAIAAEPFTTKELLEAMQPLALQSAAVVHYGERNALLVQEMQARGAQVEELMLYEWQLPADIAPLRTLVTDLIERRVGAVVFTSQVQVRHLFLVAKDMIPPDELARVLNTQTVVASVGPTCTATLQEFGITPHVEPEHPKIGHLLKALVEYMK